MHYPRLLTAACHFHCRYIHHRSLTQAPAAVLTALGLVLPVTYCLYRTVLHHCSLMYTPAASSRALFDIRTIVFLQSRRRCRWSITLHADHLHAALTGLMLTVANQICQSKPYLRKALARGSMSSFWVMLRDVEECVAMQGVVLAATFAVSHNVEEAKPLAAGSATTSSLQRPYADRDWGIQQASIIPS